MNTTQAQLGGKEMGLQGTSFEVRVFQTGSGSALLALSLLVLVFLPAS